MAKRKTISESEISAIVQAEIQNADGFASSRLSNERTDNLNAYFGRPYGTEQEGRSTVVSRDVQQTIEWKMPTYMRIFTSGEDIVSFEPSSQENVNAAKQATEYVNYVFQTDNPGFRILYEWFKDAEISKNGIVKAYWDASPKQKRERYSGLDDQTFAVLVADKAVKVAEHTETTGTIIGPMGQPMEATFHDVVLTRTIPFGKVCVRNVPPEEFLISKEARAIKDARMVGHRKMWTISDLRKEGYPASKIDDLASDDNSNATDSEVIVRNTVEDQSGDSADPLNNAMRQVWVTEAYMRVDVDGDGIAEMRKITCAGPGYTVLSNEAWEGDAPLISLTGIIMPHRFWGLCDADLSRDSQLIKTTLYRQMLDNMYLTNNQREEVDEARIIDPDELLSSAPGRKIRVKPGNGPAISPIVVPNIIDGVLAGLNYVDQQDENNTGVSARTQGLGSNVLHKTAAGERMMMTAAMGKTELMARVFAETGVKDLFRMILNLVVRYQDKPRTVKLTGGWVEMDPSQWDPDMDLKVSVGLGMGDRDQQLMSSRTVGQMQQALLPLGFITPENIKNNVELGLNGLGLKGVDRFVTIPQGPQAKQPIQLPQPQQQQKPGTDPQTLIAMEQIKAKGKSDVAQINAQAKVATDTHLNQLELQRHTMENRQAMQLEAFKAKMDTAVELAVAHIRAAAHIESARIAAKADDGAEAEAREASQEAA